MYDYAQDNLSVMSSCYTCNLIGEVCPVCQDTRDARLTDKAWEVVDEGNLIYRIPLSFNQAQPSGHDWTERDGEFAPPIVQLVDGGTYEELWELDDETQRNREVECKWCHLMTPKQFNQCQDCDGILEHNVR